MTDHTPLTDEDLSAQIDGQADPDLSDRIARDAQAQERSAALGRARDALGTPVAPLAEDQVDQLIGVALAAADDDQVVPLASRGRRGAPRWLAAAAAVLVVAGLGFILTGALGGSSSNQSADTATAGRSTTSTDAESSKATPEAAPGTGGGSVAADRANTSAALDEAAARRFAADATDLGVFAGDAALRSALKTSWPTTEPATPSGIPADKRTAQQIARCGTQIQTLLRLTTGPTEVGYAELAGEPVLVFEFASSSYEDGTATSLVSAADPVACNPKVTFER